MFLFKTVLKAFILPPGIFIISLIFTGAWFLYKKKWKAGIVTLIFGCFAWALSIAPISDAMIKGLESEYSIPKNVQGDVIILLGAGVSVTAPDLSGLGAPDEDYLTRIVTAVRLQKKLDIPIIVGDKVSENKVEEDYIIKRLLIDLGVSVEKIFIDDKSKDTFGNVKFAQGICARSGFRNPILVTSAYHLKRAVMSSEKIGLKVLPFPAGFKSWREKYFRWKAFSSGNFLI